MRAIAVVSVKFTLPAAIIRTRFRVAQLVAAQLHVIAGRCGRREHLVAGNVPEQFVIRQMGTGALVRRLPMRVLSPIAVDTGRCGWWLSDVVIHRRLPCRFYDSRMGRYL
jgi:hypothetical protein